MNVLSGSCATAYSVFAQRRNGPPAPSTHVVMPQRRPPNHACSGLRFARR